MRDLATLKFMAARVTEYVKAHPSTLPLLGESEPPVRASTCRYGHLMSQDGKGRRCRVCLRAWKRRRYAERRAG